MALFRFFTENSPRFKRNVERTALHIWPQGFTVLESQGVWKGGKENSLILEVAQDDTRQNREIAHRFARLIKRANRQEAVLLQVIQNSLEFI